MGGHGTAPATPGAHQRDPPEQTPTATEATVGVHPTHWDRSLTRQLSTRNRWRLRNPITDHHSPQRQNTAPNLGPDHHPNTTAQHPLNTRLSQPQPNTTNPKSVLPCTRCTSILNRPGILGASGVPWVSWRRLTGFMPPRRLLGRRGRRVGRSSVISVESRLPTVFLS